jgi:hypothetical protein
MKQANYNTIREWIFTLLLAAIGAVLMVSMVFGSALQEQDKLSALAAVEVGE